MTDYKTNVLMVINPAEVKARQYLSQYKDFEIVDWDSLNFVLDILKEAKNMKKNIEAHEKDDLADLKAELKERQERYKLPKVLLDEVDDMFRPKANAYYAEQQRIKDEKEAAERRAKEDEALKEAEKLEALKKDIGEYDEATQAAINSSIEDKQNALIEASAKVQKTTLSNDKVVVKKVWKFRVVDISKVPSEFLMVDTVKVNQAIRDGAREIAGLEIFEDTQVAIRG